MNTKIPFIIAASMFFVASCSDVKDDDTGKTKSALCLTFTDSAIEGYAMTNWDTDHNQCIDSTEAAAVTQIPPMAFANNSDIHSLDDLNQFPHLTKIGDGAFSGCTNLTSANIFNVTVIGDSAFNGCTGLITVNAQNASQVAGNAFSGCTSLNTVNIPTQYDVTCPASCKKGCDAGGNCIPDDVNCPASCKKGCDAGGNCIPDDVTCPASCQNGCDASGNCIPDDVTCPASCKKGCDANGNCTDDPNCPQSCPNQCDSNGKCYAVKGAKCTEADVLNIQDADGRFYSESLSIMLYYDGLHDRHRCSADGKESLICMGYLSDACSNDNPTCHTWQTAEKCTNGCDDAGRCITEHNEDFDDAVLCAENGMDLLGYRKKSNTEYGFFHKEYCPYGCYTSDNGDQCATKPRKPDNCYYETASSDWFSNDSEVVEKNSGYAFCYETEEYDKALLRYSVQCNQGKWEYQYCDNLCTESTGQCRPATLCYDEASGEHKNEGFVCSDEDELTHCKAGYHVKLSDDYDNVSHPVGQTLSSKNCKYGCEKGKCQTGSLDDICIHGDRMCSEEQQKAYFCDLGVYKDAGQCESPKDPSEISSTPLDATHFDCGDYTYYALFGKEFAYSVGLVEEIISETAFASFNVKEKKVRDFCGKDSIALCYTYFLNTIKDYISYLECTKPCTGDDMLCLQDEMMPGAYYYKCTQTQAGKVYIRKDIYRCTNDYSYPYELEDEINQVCDELGFGECITL